mgnify:CR=1 FL=1
MKIRNLSNLYAGLNIEGPRPMKNLPTNCGWLNIIIAIDEPLNGLTFDDVMKKVLDDNLDTIEEAVGIDIEDMLDNIIDIVEQIKSKYTNPLVHIHQYEGTTNLHERIYKATGVKSITDKTNYYEFPTNYARLYPTTDFVLSLSQCAGLGAKAGEWIVPNGFAKFDIKKNTISKNIQITMNNDEFDLTRFSPKKGLVLYVDDLWNPTNEDMDIDILIERLVEPDQ